MEFNHPDEMKNKDEGESREGHGNELKVDFSAFVLSLSSSALIALGEVADPISKEKKPNIILARQMIDVINMLHKKTKGNLTKEEEELILSLCSELKMKYLRSVKINK